MADTLPNVKLLKGGTWVDLYAATSIVVGNIIEVHSLNASDVEIALSLAMPSGNSGFRILTKGEVLNVPANQSGVWAKSQSGASINVGLFQGSDLPDLEYNVTIDGKTIPSQALQFLDNIAFVDGFGQAITANLDSQISLNFAYGLLDETFDVKAPVISGDGAASASSGCAIVSSAITGEATIESRNSIRYSNGRGFFAYFTASFEGSGIGYAGGVDDTDGFPIKVTNGVMEFLYVDNGVEKSAQVVNTEGLDLTKINIFAVLGGFLGVANPTLLVKKGKWRALSVIETEGVLTETHVRLPAFPIRIKAINDMVVRSGSWHGGTMGNAGKVQDRGFSYPNQPFGLIAGENPATNPRGSITLVGVAVSTLVVLRSKLLYNGLPNKVKIDIIDYSFSIRPSAGSGTVQIQLIGNPSIAGSVFSDISPSSTLEVDDNEGTESTGVYVPGTSGGDLVGEPVNINYSGGGGQQLKIGGRGQVIIDELNLDGIAGETLAIIARDLDGNGVTIDWNLTVIERQI